MSHSEGMLNLAIFILMLLLIAALAMPLLGP
jgi:hypothetical protein